MCTASRLDVFFPQGCSSIYLPCRHWFFDFFLPFFGVKPVWPYWPLTPDINGAFPPLTAAAQRIFSSVWDHPLVNSRDGCDVGEIPADEQQCVKDSVRPCGTNNYVHHCQSRFNPFYSPFGCCLGTSCAKLNNNKLHPVVKCIYCFKFSTLSADSIVWLIRQ